MIDSNKQERRDELFRVLNLKAKQALKDVGKPTLLEKALPIIQLWEEPSFSPFVSRTVFAAYNRETRKVELTPVVKQVTWYQENEWQRVNAVLEEPCPQLEPNLTVLEAALDPEPFFILMNEGSRIEIPLLGVQPQMGHDGTFFRLSVLHAFGGFTLHWWTKPPEAWNEIVQWTYRMRTFLLDSIATSTQTDSSGQ
jgi:hypothetical protein